jgi:hypothetical protein
MLFKRKTNNSMKKISICLFYLMLFGSIADVFSQQTESLKNPKFSTTLGVGYAFQYYNNLQQGGGNGTPVRLDKYSTSQPIAFRFQLNYAKTPTLQYRLLISPFTQKGSFIANDKIKTKDVTFEKNEKIDTRFSFSSLRVGFANKVTHGIFKDFKIGATLIVRKWQTSQKSSTKNSADVNWLGLPLLYVGFDKHIAPKISVTADLDVIGIPSAYALEGGSALNFKINKTFQVGLQYRILSGFFTDGSINNAFTGQNIGLALTSYF